MQYLTPQVVFQELPNHVALAFTICGCPLKCEGCHSEHTWQQNLGETLTPARFIHHLNRYLGYIDSVVFFGGEWHLSELIELLNIAKQQKLITCLYSGFEKLPKRLYQQLDYLKLGAWQQQRGGLAEPNTNQRFIDVKSGACLNHLFQQPSSYNQTTTITG